MIQTEKAVRIQTMRVSSEAFASRQSIPRKYTCDGENVNPPLNIDQIPKEAVCLAIIVEDPDAPINTWIHWIAWNIPVTHRIDEHTARGVEGLNDFCKHFYCGPCPMSGTHRYLFKVYALDSLVHLPPSTRKSQLEKAMAEHIIGYGELMGVYKRIVPFSPTRNVSKETLK